jgi:hypothetical protein
MRRSFGDNHPEYRSMRWALLLMLVGCERGTPHRAESAPPSAPSQVTAATRSAPASLSPPPGPAAPVEPTPAPPPSSVDTFLRDHAADTHPWRVTLHDLSKSPDGTRPLFMGMRSLRHRVLSSALAMEVIDWLGAHTTYLVDEGTRACGVVVPERGVEIARGALSLRFRYNCGYVFLTDAGYNGPRAMVSSDAAVRFENIVKRARTQR